jgi:hypothetical protein
VEWLTEQPTDRSIVRLIGQSDTCPTIHDITGLYCLSDNQPRKQPTDEQVARTKGYPLGWLVSRTTAPTLQRLTA